MPIKAGVGKSIKADSFKAGAEASQDALNKISEESADVFLVFSSSQFDQKEVLAGVNSLAKGAKIIGGSTAGEFTDEGAFVNSVVVTAIKSDDVSFYSGKGSEMDIDAENAGKEMARSIMVQGDDIKALIMIPDGLAGNGADTIRGIQMELGENVFLAGGSAGDNFKSKQTFEYFNDQLLTKSVVGLGIGGNLKYGTGIRHGWSPVGIGRKATKVKGNVIYELDNKPALDIYLEYMGEKVAEKLKSNPLIAVQEGATHPLGISIGGNEYLVRQPFFAGPDGSLTCAAEIPEGSTVYLMIGDSESVIGSAREAAKDAMNQLGGVKPSLALVFSCGARSLILGKKNNEQIDAIKEIVGKDVPISGFVCYGEQAPLNEDVEKKSKKSYFHNDTVVIFIIS